MRKEEGGNREKGIKEKNKQDMTVYLSKHCSRVVASSLPPRVSAIISDIKPIHDSVWEYLMHHYNEKHRFVLQRLKKKLDLKVKQTYL